MVGANHGGGDGVMVPAKEQNHVSLQCPRLTTTNYTPWAIMVETILKAQGLWDAIDPVTGATVDARKNYTTKAIIFQYLPEDILLQVARYEYAEDVWEAIRVRFLGADRVQKARLQTLRNELERLKMKDNETIDEFAGKLSGMLMKFRNLGSTIEDEEIVRKLLNSVPNKFLQIVAAIEQYSEIDSMPFEEAVGRLKAYEERIKGKDEEEDSQSKLLLSSSNARNKYEREINGRTKGRGRGVNGLKNHGKGADRYEKEDEEGAGPESDRDQEKGRGYGRGVGRGNYKRNLRCYECERAGHFAYECPDLKEKEEELGFAKAHEDGPALL
ncbi:hypothetical protein E3N88_20767 [Mikania micrantha]|uniref:CCHC-type domain-containing protein n=1 Tax=Mikania micrantha TaxID=192012 RepID=A0A5N6NID4_9ASTR|nr:hypothetical protein E3N88_20767 [Mikania micrantha]